MLKLIDKIIKSGRFSEVFRFSVNGGISFVVDFGVLYFLTEFAGIYYLLSAAISFSLAVTVNYFICVWWVFRGAKNTGGRAKFIFAASSAVGLGLNQLIMWFSVTILGVYYLAAKIISTIIVMCWNYIMKRHALYMKKGEQK